MGESPIAKGTRWVGGQRAKRAPDQWAEGWRTGYLCLHFPPEASQISQGRMVEARKRVKPAIIGRPHAKRREVGQRDRDILPKPPEGIPARLRWRGLTSRSDRGLGWRARG